MIGSLDRLQQWIATRSRLPLGSFPTPLVRLDRLGGELGIELWMKRDECSGLAMGGNKTRKLEFILADAVARGYDTLVTTGPVTSNHTMMTAVAARRAGLGIHCVVGGQPPVTWSGNLLLLEYLGATVHFVPMNFAQPSIEEAERLRAHCDQVVGETRGYWIPGGGSMTQGEPGYMNAVLEIARQRGDHFDFDHVVLAYGTGSTTTGLVMGLALAGIHTSVEAVAVSSRHALEVVFKRRMPAERIAESMSRLGMDLPELPSNRVIFGFAEEGYGVPNLGSDQAIRWMAQTEGYLLDPVYTAKAFSGLTSMVRDGRIQQGARVLFVHTGGLTMTGAPEKRYAGAAPAHTVVFDHPTGPE